MARRRTYEPLRVYLNNRLVGFPSKETGGDRLPVRSKLARLGAYAPNFTIPAPTGNAFSRRIGHRCIR